MVNWKEYLEKFEAILHIETPPPPYDNPEYLNYLKLNKSRQNRWLKTAKINNDLENIIKNINQQQTWYLIVEPWCGDAAHITPFIFLMSEINPNITLKIVYRDTPPFMIDDYLTDGGKSIPKLIIRDSKENDIHVWGPRPKACQRFYLDLKEQNISVGTLKEELQKWYNTDKGNSIQKEFLELLK